MGCAAATGPSRSAWPWARWPGCPWPSAGSCCWPWGPGPEPAAGLILVEVVFLLVFCGWGLFPLLSFAGDASLDPSRLALLPLRPGQLVGGLSLAACVGGAPRG